jgi:hypothetical protein
MLQYHDHGGDGPSQLSAIETKMVPKITAKGRSAQILRTTNPSYNTVYPYTVVFIIFAVFQTV